MPRWMAVLGPGKLVPGTQGIAFAFHPIGHVLSASPDWRWAPALGHVNGGGARLPCPYTTLQGP